MSYPQVSKTAVGTYKGLVLDFLDPDPAQIHIEDIAHALSIEPRWSGTTFETYSVGQHSVTCAMVAPYEFKLQCLMHDSAEAYIKDIARPLKKAIGPSIVEIENRLLRVIGDKFGVELVDLPAEVREIDDRMMVTESLQLRPTEAHNAIPILVGTEPFGITLREMSQARAEIVWMEMFHLLTSDRYANVA